MPDTLTVVIRMIAAEGKAEALQKELTTLVMKSRAEKGCIRCVMKRGVDDPNVFVLIQEWRNRVLWEAHRSGAAVTAFRDSVAPDAIASSEVHPLTTMA